MKRVTMITGASGGIGEGFARRLAAEGHDLVLVARSRKPLHELCDELMLKYKINAHYIVMDLAEFNADLKLKAETDRHDLEVDWLINNAGYGSMGDFAELDLDNELRMIELNISALVALTHAYLPGMRERRRGVIINVSSTASFQPIPFMATYAATKAFVSSFTEAIAEENRPFGVRIFALCPGATKTNFFNAAHIDKPLAVKGVQTVDDVIDVAMNAIHGSKPKVISGLANKIGAFLGAATPNRLSSKVMAKALRERYQSNREQMG